MPRTIPLSAFFQKRGRRFFPIPTSPLSRPRMAATVRFSPQLMATMAAGLSGRSSNFCVPSKRMGDSSLGCWVERKLDFSPIQSLSRMKLGAKIGLAILVLSLSLVLSAEPISQLKPTNYVNDFAGVLDPNTVAQLNGLCQEVDQKAHAQIAVVTIKSLDGSDIDSYAVALFKQWGIGAKSTDHGVLILLATQDHRYRVEVGYGLEPILPDGKVGGFGREAVPLLKSGDYAGAVTLMTARVASVIAQDAGVTFSNQTRNPANRPRPAPSGGGGGGGFFIFIF